MKKWDETLAAAAPLIEFLQRDSLFDAPYNGSTQGTMVITDAKIANHFAVEDCDEFDYWQSVSGSECDFPESFEWDSGMDRRLQKKHNEYFGLLSKNFNGAKDKFDEVGTGQLIELMLRDIHYLFNCYANDYFPPIWQKMLDVYLHNGFPCGWNGHYPEGRLVVFSNF
ncbi:MAG: hypothetical protein LBU53_03895 [Zoogloeaceae bacterium]|jgi:hypothetical protein|nr:hypothetical protein [Zoogloeaceae bacterium]